MKIQALLCDCRGRVRIRPLAGMQGVRATDATKGSEEDDRCGQVAKEAGFSLHAGVAAQAWERDKLERLCGYLSRPAVSEKRLSLTSAGNIRYKLKTPFLQLDNKLLFQLFDVRNNLFKFTHLGFGTYGGCNLR